MDPTSRLIVLFVVLVCTDVVHCHTGNADKSRSNASNGNVASRGDRNVDARIEMMRCGLLVKTTCASDLQAFFPNGDMTNRAAMAENLKNRNPREICRMMTDLEACASRTLNGQCSATARQTILMLAGQAITAVRNMLQYTCIQHIDDIEMIETCNEEKQRQGINITADALMRCPNMRQDAIVATVGHTGNICGLRPGFNCFVDVLKSHCGDHAGDIVQGLYTGMFRDFGCDTNSRRVKRFVQMVRRAFK